MLSFLSIGNFTIKQLNSLDWLYERLHLLFSSFGFWNFGRTFCSKVLSVCQGIPEQAEVPPVARVPAPEQAANPPAQPTQPAAVPSSAPNANPLDLFPQVVVFANIFVAYAIVCKVSHGLKCETGSSKHGNRCCRCW